jgi:hypothetical protein
MRKIGISLVAIATAVLVGVAPQAANAADTSSSPTAKFDFPSADSTVVGSVGFIDDTQVGYFWSMARGDSVAETFSGPKKVKKAVLKLDVITNGLAAGVEADWNVSINGKDIGSFAVKSGESGARTLKYKGFKVKGGTYDVKIYMTNEVPGGAGAHTLRYAGAGAHSITLKKK